MCRLHTRSFAAFIAILFVAQPALIADVQSKSQPDSAPVIRDIELSADRTATGYVVDQAGNPVAGVQIELHSNAGIVEGTTDESGRFRAAGLAGGPCVVKVGDAAYGCRFWVQGTAPPKSLKSFSVVDQATPVVRGQNNDDDDSFFGGGHGHLEELTGLTHAQLIGLGLTAGAVIGLIVAIESHSD